MNGPSRPLTHGMADRRRVFSAAQIPVVSQSIDGCRQYNSQRRRQPVFTPSTTNYCTAADTVRTTFDVSRVIMKACMGLTD